MLEGILEGVEAVVDKDLAAVVLAVKVDADALLLLTDVPAVHLGWGSADRLPIRRLSLAGAAQGVADGTFPSGSMGPKVAAAAAFVRRTGKFAAIGALGEAVAVLERRSGTQLVGSIDERRRDSRARQSATQIDGRDNALAGPAAAKRSGRKIMPVRWSALVGPTGNGATTRSAVRSTRRVEP